MQTFTHPIFGKTRVLNRDGEIWIAGKDAAQVLGYKGHIGVIKTHVMPEDKHLLRPSETEDKTIPALGLTIINGNGLRSLVNANKSKLAEEYYKWITYNVEPRLQLREMRKEQEVNDLQQRLTVTNSSEQGETNTDILNELAKLNKYLEDIVRELSNICDVIRCK